MLSLSWVFLATKHGLKKNEIAVIKKKMQRFYFLRFLINQTVLKTNEIAVIKNNY